MKMSNKSAGTQFEREFSYRLAEEVVWVNRFKDSSRITRTDNPAM